MSSTVVVRGHSEDYMNKKKVCLFVCIKIKRTYLSLSLLFQHKNLDFRLSFHIEIKFDDGQKYSFGMKKKEEHTSEVTKNKQFSIKISKCRFS